mgnify:CR=1 FL=1
MHSLVACDHQLAKQLEPWPPHICCAHTHLLRGNTRVPNSLTRGHHRFAVHALTKDLLYTLSLVAWKHQRAKQLEPWRPKICWTSQICCARTHLLRGNTRVPNSLSRPLGKSMYMHGSWESRLARDPCQMRTCCNCVNVHELHTDHEHSCIQHTKKVGAHARLLGVSHNAKAIVPEFKRNHVKSALS